LSTEPVTSEENQDSKESGLELPPSVTCLQKEDGETAYIIGTAHISAKSIEDVENVIAAVKPEAVVVELCQARYDSLSDPNRWKKMDVSKVVRQGKGMLLLVNLLLSSYQRKMGEEMGVKPGAEMMKAVELARETGAQLELGDRDVQVTLGRTWGGLGFWQRLKLMGSFFDSAFGVEEKLEEEELERLKEGDVLNEMLEDMGKSFPTIRERLISERDLWLMDSVYRCPGQNVVAVVGAGHVPGMKEHWGKEIDRAALCEKPKPGMGWTIFKWGFPLLIIVSLIWAFVNHDSGWEAVQVWFMANGLLSALGALIALGHPLSILAAFVAAPITSLVPTVGAGMVTGLVEAMVRKPKVEDCETLADDSGSLKGWYGNRITRVLLVVTLSTLGSAIGTYLGAYGVFNILGASS
jgi:pheromone shutdown-related protein TraB